jgi:16S rRNA (uracil1498-N3)-methyltransferase
MIPRFYCSFPLAPGAVVELPAEAAHHAVKVLRLSAGDTVILFDGRGGQWQARLAPAGKSVRAVLEAFEDTEREAPVKVILAQALPAADKMDWIVQKGVELGVAAFRPVAARRSVIRLSGERMERRVAHWRSVAVAACEQSGRNRVPEVASLVDLPQFLGAASEDNGMRLLLSQAAGVGLRELPPPAGPVTLLVGPEGGFEENELLAATAAGFQAMTLGPRVLRTETAGLAAVAAMMTLWGDF